MSSFADSRITESSGLAYSASANDLLYTLNDETTKPHIFAVRPSDGVTVGTASVKGVTLVDPEAICVDHGGVIWLADIGDNSSSRSTISVYSRGEPGYTDHGDMSFSRYILAYPDGPHNAETFIVHPITRVAYIITKTIPGKMYSLPGSLVVGSTNTLVDTGVTMPDEVSDGAFTPDGRFLLLRRKDQNSTVFVYETTGWTAQTSIPVPTLTKPEGITVSPDQLTFWISSEGKHAPLLQVDMPTDYQPLAPPPAAPSPCEDIPPPTPEETPPAKELDLTNWKLTLPTGSKGSPLEIKQPTLATYRDDRFFHFDPTPVTGGTIFSCPGNGVTTKNSKNPRTELREMTNNGQTLASWSTTSGTHYMRVRQKITAAPHDVVVGQIHDANDDVTVVRYIVGEGLWATDGDNIHGHVIDAGYVLDTFFEIEFTTTGGSIETKYNGVVKQTLPASRSGCYFRAGSYHQSHGEGADPAVVVIAELEISHT